MVGGSRCLRVSLVCPALVVLQLAVLRQMNYSSCVIFGADPAEVDLAPTPDFQIGRLSWPVSDLARSEALAPFRRDFQKHCDGKRGMAAALCVSEWMVKAFPWGAPRRDFYSPTFDPVADFDDHVIRGEPGHCVTRSGILVAELLSVGIPARLAQVFTADGGGHNISEVWDQDLGWVLIDPSFGGTISLDGRPLSAVSALGSSRSLQVIGGGSSAAQGGPFYMKGLKGGTILYPSPWRYLRTGPRSAMWPFMGRFARIGAGHLKYGGVQSILRTGIVVCLILFLVLLAYGLSPLRRQGAVRPRPAVLGVLLDPQ